MINYSKTIFKLYKDCEVILGGEAVGVGAPGIKVCPLTTPVGSMTIRVKNHVIDPVKGLPFYITTLGDHLDEGKAMRLLSSDDSFSGEIHNNIEAYKTHIMHYAGETPSFLVFEISDAEHMTWYRMSICIGKGTEISAMHGRRFNYGNDLRGQGWNSNPLIVTSFEELNTAEHDAVFVDLERGWVHLRLLQTEDRTKGGIVTDRQETGQEEDWPTYQTGDSPGWDFNDVGIGSNWRMNMAYGEHQMEIFLDPLTLDGQGVCDDFPFPEPGTQSGTTTTPETTTIVTTTTATTTTSGKVHATII